MKATPHNITLDDTVLAKSLLQDAISHGNDQAVFPVLAWLCASRYPNDHLCQQRGAGREFLDGVQGLSSYGRAKLFQSFLKVSIYDEQFDGLVLQGRERLKLETLAPA